MSQFLRQAMEVVAYFHDYLLELAKSAPYHLSDKDMHFLVIALFGLAMMIFIYPLFKFLNRKGSVFGISWIYVFTFTLIVCVAIEIGQKITGTGEMDFNDIVAGMAGFLALSLALLVLRFLWWIISTLLFGERKPKRRR